MLEGEAMVQLKDYLDYTRSAHSELFDLHYYFTLKALFEDEEDKVNWPFEQFVVEQTKKDLEL